MRCMHFSLLLLTFTILAAATQSSAADSAQIKELLATAGIQPEGDRRGQMDVIGFVTNAKQMDHVLAQCDELAAPCHSALDDEHGWNGNTSFIAGVCPHDDYYYAGRLYSLLLSRIHAKRVILFGVFHKARLFDIHNRLVFDSYREWHGPYGPVAVSSLREDIIARLPQDTYIIDNDMHMVEHSLEAIVPFLQAYNRDVEIVSILVPYMQWETMARLAADLSNALAAIITDNNWKLGEDVSIISSADAIHYGDAGWGGSDFAEYGSDIAGYEMAVARDTELARLHLCGTVAADKLKAFLYKCVDKDDVTQYHITWCGRFSIPLGLNVANRLTQTIEGRALTGTLLDYGTSVSEASLSVDGLDGLGTTAPNNLHHFVGYASIGYR
ncbi:MAG: AmmeMemoRadiSam system protein B [Candidatus Latescibacterota bacterium]